MISAVISAVISAMISAVISVVISAVISVVISLPVCYGMYWRKAGRLHSPKVNLPELREDLLKAAVDRLESCLRPGGPGGHRATSHPGAMLGEISVSSRNFFWGNLGKGKRSFTPPP